MKDTRVERMARVLVRHSLDLQPGNRLGVRSGTLATPLLQAVLQESLRAGAHVEMFVQPPGVQEILLREGSEKQLARVSASWHMVLSEFEAMLDIQALENSKSLNTIDSERKMMYGRVQGQLVKTFLQRCIQGDLRWTKTLFPTNAYAQDTGLSLEEFEDLFYHACFLDEDDPISRWRQLSQQQERYISRLNGKRSVRLKGRHTDITFSIQGRVFLNEDGRGNFPGGEFFTAPVENSVNGSVLFNLPTINAGQELEQVWLHFVEGRVVEAKARKGQEYLESVLRLDEGACRFGEFAFGNNPCVQRYTRNTLIDEKMAKTVHFALGASIPGTGGVNQSSLHWDMVYDLKPGSEVYVDDELFCKDGCFVE
jgi:aminopeptidase